MSDLVLHDFEFDENCYKVRLLLAALAQPFRKVAVNMVPGAEQARPPLLLLNPLGTLPILEDGATVLREAEAILAYLALRFDPARRWLPAEPAAFGAVMAWLAFAARDLHAAVLARRHALFDEPADGAALEAAARRAFRAMEDHLTARRFRNPDGGADWVVGATPTVADLALFPSFALSRDFAVEHESYPALRRWARRVRTLPGFATMPGIPDYH